MTEPFISVGTGLAFLLGLAIGSFIIGYRATLSPPTLRGIGCRMHSVEVDLLEHHGQPVEIRVPQDGIFRFMSAVGSKGILWYEGSFVMESRQVILIPEDSALFGMSGAYLGSLSYWGGQRTMHIFEAG